MKNISLLLLLSIIIISCLSPLDKAYKQDTLEEDIVALKESISEEELNTLEGYIAIKKVLGSDDEMLGKTYNDLLNEAKKMKLRDDRYLIERNLEKVKEDAMKVLIETEKYLHETEKYLQKK